MKYKGKYSLNENLLKGRGMRLLKEEEEFTPYKRPERASRISGSGTSFTHDLSDKTFSSERSARNSLSPLEGTEAEMYVQSMLQSWKLAAGREGGSNSYDVHFNKGSETYNVEVGLYGKVLQCGEGIGDAFIDTDKDKHKKRQAALGGKPKGAVGKDKILAAWKAGGDDFLTMFDGTDTYWFSLNADAAAVELFKGKKAPELTVQSILSDTLKGAGTPSSGDFRNGPSFSDIEWNRGLKCPIEGLTIDWSKRWSGRGSVRDQIVPEEPVKDPSKA